MTAGHARRLTRVTRYRSPASCTGVRPAAAPAHPAMPAPPAAAEARAIDSGFQAFWPRRASVAAALPPDAVPLRTKAADPHATSHSRIGDPAANSTAQGQGSVEQPPPHTLQCEVVECGRCRRKRCCIGGELRRAPQRIPPRRTLVQRPLQRHSNTHCGLGITADRDIQAVWLPSQWCAEGGSRVQGFLSAPAARCRRCGGGRRRGRPAPRQPAPPR